MAEEKTCKYGHPWVRTRFYQCAPCKKVTNSVALRLRSGDLWRDAPKSDANRQADWATFCERLDGVLAETRRAEGFDSRTRTYQTLGDRSLYLPVQPARQEAA